MEAGCIDGANAISKQKGVLTNMRLARREDDECDLALDVEVRDTRHLAEGHGHAAGLRRRSGGGSRKRMSVPTRTLAAKRPAATR